MTRLRTVAPLVVSVLFMQGLVMVSDTQASECAIPEEGLELELQSVAVAGESQSLDQYPTRTALLYGNELEVTFEVEGVTEQHFGLRTECGGEASSSPYPDLSACSDEGRHCHWPASTYLCAGHCSGGEWHIYGCE